jgi:hypothetical protein
LVVASAVAVGSLAPVAGSASAATTRPGVNLAAKWSALAVTKRSMRPALWLGADGRAYVIWLQEPAAPTVNKDTYDVAVISPTGAVAGPPQSLFGPSYWGGLSDQASVVTDGGAPLLVFSGSRGTTGKDPYDIGCVVGAMGPKVPWSLQHWSLSANCVNPIAAATVGPGGQLSAAWPGGWTSGHGVLFRTSQSPAIPASTPDSHIALSGPANASRVAEASDRAGNGHVYVAWAQVFSSARDGLYVEDVSRAGPPTKAPGSGSNSANIYSFGGPAIASTAGHPGVFLAYCSNGPTCGVQLWRVGAARATTIPGSSGASDVALSAGPAGRLWAAWYNPSNNTVSVVRTDEADNRFGPVHVLATACSEHGVLGLSSGPWGRLDIALECVNQASRQEVYVSQEIRPLTVSSQFLTVASYTYVTKVSHGKKVRVAIKHERFYGKFRTTDVGDPVAGAKVAVAGYHGTTGPDGYFTVGLPAAVAGGAHAVTATAPNYLPAKGVLQVDKP